MSCSKPSAWTARGRRSAAGAALLGLLACGGPAPAPPPEPPALIVLISLDTFRADSLDRRRADGGWETPHLRRLAETSLRFDAAFAPIAFTLPAHLTLLTGVHPETHGVLDENGALPPAIPTLAEGLRARGYRTIGIVNSGWLRDEHGFGRGFDRYRRLDETLGSGARVRAAALDELARAARDGVPLFLFLHFFEAHSDFVHLGSNLTYWSPPEQRADLAIAEHDVCDQRARCATEFLAAADQESRPLTAAQVSLQHELYRRGVRALDAELGSLFDALRARRDWPRTLLVLTADHGEEFREHGRFLHTQVFDECLRVPLLVRLPAGARAGARVTDLADLADVAPTILAAAGAPRPAAVQGRDLLAGEAAAAALVALDRTVPDRYALRTGELLLVSDLPAGPSRLFDRRHDPAERRDLAAARAPEVVELTGRLTAELRALRAARPAPAAAPPLEEAERARLRSLGYL